MFQHSTRSAHRAKRFALALSFASLGAIMHAQAQTAPVSAAVTEAGTVHSIATAARLCGFLSETELNRVRMRLDRVHTAPLSEQDRETYLIMRSSDNFRNYVYARALNKVQTGCSADLRNTWSDLQASIPSLDTPAAQMHASL